MKWMLTLSAVILAWTAWGSEAQACAVLPQSVLEQHVEIGPDLRQFSEVDSRCRYSWRKANYAELLEQQQENIRERMRRGSEDTEPVYLYQSVEAQLLFQGQTPSEAQAAFARYAQGRQEKTYGSPDPLDNTQWEAVEGQDALWSPARRRFLVRRERSLVLVSLQVNDAPEEDLELAKKLSAQLNLAVSLDDDVVRD